MARRIKDDAAPLQIEHLRRRHNAAFVAVTSRKELKFHIKTRSSGGYVDVKPKHVDGVAHPLQPAAVGLNHQAGESVDPAGGRMSSRVPFGIKQRQRAALHWDRFLDAED